MELLDNLSKQEMIEVLLGMRDKRKWDTKDWSRAVGLKQYVLEDVISGIISISKDDFKDLLLVTEKASSSGLMRFSEPIVILSWARKGGNGKTTIATNLTYHLGAMGYNTLGIDGDSQADMTSTFFPDYLQMKEKNIYDAMIRRKDFRNYVIHTNYDNIDIVPGSGKTEELERTFSAMPEEIAMDTFKECLKDIIKENYYDFVVVDMDKTMGLLNKTFLNGAKYVLAIGECSFYSIKALIPVMERIEMIKGTNSKLDCLGLVFNKVDLRKGEVERAREDASGIFKWPILKTYISSDAAIENSQRATMPLGAYKNSSRANKQFKKLTIEVLETIEKEQEGAGE